MRYASADDFAAIAELDGASFGFHYSDDDLLEARLDVEPTRFLIEEDGDRVVGATTDVALTMTLPGGEIPAAGITWVSVEITHRRRGILRRLVERQLRDRAQDGFTAAILTASEGAIYARYGFGVAEYAPEAVIDRQRARLRTTVDDHRVQRLTTAAARPLLVELHERWRRRTPGAVNRTPDRWELLLGDRPHSRDGASGLFHLVHPDGFVSYRISENWNSGLPQHVCRVVDHVAVTDEAHAALWQVLLANDLVGRIETRRLTADDPLPLLLTDPRHVRWTANSDGLWVRPLDVAALLAARTYALDLDVVLDVPDPLFGDRRYRLTGGPDGAWCEPTDRAADARLDVAALGAAVVGGTRLARLARAGQVAAEPAVLTRLDRAFLADRAPCLGTPF